MYLLDIHQWMSGNFLKLNSAKTECLLIGTFQQLSKFNISALNVAGVQVTLQQKPVRNLGVIAMKEHDNERSCPWCGSFCVISYAQHQQDMPSVDTR